MFYHILRAFYQHRHTLKITIGIIFVALIGISVAVNAIEI